MTAEAPGPHEFRREQTEAEKDGKHPWPQRDQHDGDQQGESCNDNDNDEED